MHTRAHMHYYNQPIYSLHSRGAAGRLLQPALRVGPCWPPVHCLCPQARPLRGKPHDGRPPVPGRGLSRRERSPADTRWPSAGTAVAHTSRRLTSAPRRGGYGRGPEGGGRLPHRVGSGGLCCQARSPHPGCQWGGRRCWMAKRWRRCTRPSSEVR